MWVSAVGIAQSPITLLFLKRMFLPCRSATAWLPGALPPRGSTRARTGAEQPGKPNTRTEGACVNLRFWTRKAPATLPLSPLTYVARPAPLPPPTVYAAVHDL